MTILFTASEMTPFCKTGGLADVIGSLPPVLAGMGHEVSVMLPGYSVIDRDRYGFEITPHDIRIPVGETVKPLAVSSTVWQRVTVYLLENCEYLDREGLYGDIDGDYSDNCDRFVFYCRGVIETAKRLGLFPDIVHAHDWQAGLVIAYLATVYAADSTLKNAATLFTIHNLGYQGLFPAQCFLNTGLPPETYDWKKMEFWGKVSFLKGGIVYADAVSTVSETYAIEITRQELGFGMDGVLSQRQNDLYGIVNGIDTVMWNPETDTAIPAQYGVHTLSGKALCRAELLKRCKLDAALSTPVFGMVTRLDDQKGLDILEDAVPSLAALDIRLVIIGTGTKKHHETMKKMMSLYPRHVAVILRFDNDMARLVYAGADAFLMPSRYEPCGLGQLIAMSYGTLPVVHATGGLEDTVIDVDADPDNGNGFSFDVYTADALVRTVSRAVQVFRESGRARWNKAVYNAMKKDFSWQASALQYVKLYQRLRNRKDSEASKV